MPGALAGVSARDPAQPERLEVLAGARLADELAEAIQRERARPNMTADLVVERVT